MQALRRLVLLGGLALTAGLGPRSAQAGRQIEEPLADAVRTALSAAVAQGAPPRPSFNDIDARLGYLRWLGEMSQRLRRRKPDPVAREAFLETLWYESRRAGLDVALVLGLIEVESGFRKYAVSVVGARGYMQVMPFWMRTIGGAGADVGGLFHLQTNLRFGCVILRHYLDRERGDLFMALGRYNGSRGRAEYPRLVFAARRRWEFEDIQFRPEPKPTRADSAAVPVQSPGQTLGAAPSIPISASTRSTVSSTSSATEAGR